MFKRVVLAAVAVGFVMFLASSADANFLLPDSIAAPDLFFPVPPNVPFLGDTGILPYVTSTGTIGTYRAVVFADPLRNIVCPNCLTFLYQVFNTGSLTPQAIQRITATGYSGFTTDVGFTPTPLIEHVGSSVPTVFPGSVDRDLTGAVVGFNYPAPGSVPPGSTTVDMEIITNATAFSSGTLSVIDFGVATVSAFAPIPEPNSLALLSSGVLGLVGASWRRQRRR